MNLRERYYWAFRTDKYNKDLIFTELKRGRLRQGWGYDDSQDLRLIQEEKDKGGSWWNRLTQEQKEALPHLRMLGAGDDSIKLEDIILLPNLPEDGLFCLAEVTGNYDFNKCQLSEEQAKIWGATSDYGHILNVKLLTHTGINKYSKEVDARLRSSLRTPMRLWSLRDYKEYIDHLILCLEKNDNLLDLETGAQRVESAWSSAINASKIKLKDELEKSLDSKFKAAEWEEPIKFALESLYSGSNVRWTAGPSEHGADLVIELPDHIDDGFPWLILIQVKNYIGQIEHDKLGQLEEAYNKWSEEGKVIQAVLMTTAKKKSNTFEEHRTNLENKLGIPIKLVLRERLMEIMVDGLAASPFNINDTTLK